MGHAAEKGPAMGSGILVREASRIHFREHVSLKARHAGGQESRQTKQVIQIYKIKITETAKQESQHRA